MKANLKKSVTLKSGKTFAAGTEFEVTPGKNPRYAILRAGNEVYKIQSIKLPELFSEFVDPTIDQITEMASMGYSVSLVGEEIELDGIDCEGWPSILLARGII